MILDNRKYSADDWCGGICYRIIPLIIKGEHAYTLLSWDGNNGVSYKKIIDVLWFDRKGKAIFGKPMFRQGRSISHRVVMEYNAKSSLLLTYDENEKGNNDA